MIAQLWQPLAASPALSAGPRPATSLNVIGRMATGVDRDAARADLDRIAARLATIYPDTNAGVTISMEGLLDGLARANRPVLMIIMGAVAFVLLTACANLAALLLARAAHRSREIAIRLSVGATRWRIVRQLLLESVLIAALAAIVGVALSGFGARLLGVGFNVIDPGMADTTPYWVNLSMNRSGYFFVGAIALFSTLAFGLLPALQLSKTDVLVALKDGGRGGTGSIGARRWSGALIVGQLALTMTLLAATALLWRNFVATTHADVVVDTSNLMTGRFTLPAPKYDAPRRQRFLAELTDRLSSAPGLTEATLTASTPFEPMPSRSLSIEGRPSGRESAAAVSRIRPDRRGILPHLAAADRARACAHRR